MTNYLAIGIVVGISQRSKRQRRHGLDGAEELVVETEKQKLRSFTDSVKQLLQLPKKKK